MWHFVSLPNFLEKRNFCTFVVQDNCKGRLRAILSNSKTLSVEVFYKEKAIYVWGVVLA